MRKKYTLTLLPVVLLCLTSCVDHAHIRRILRHADSIIEAEPDSALALLYRDSLLFTKASPAERMEYEMIKHEAEDKCYVPHTSDSGMLRVVEYYEAEGTPLQQVRSNYVLGRVHFDMQHYGSALTTFENALKIEIGNDSTAYRYKARACTWIAAIYEDKQLYEDAMRYSKQYYGYALKADDRTERVYALRDIGREYCYLKQNNTAIRYYKNAAKEARLLNNEYLYNMVMEELAAVYIEERMFDKARMALSTSCRSSLDVDLAPHYFTWSILYDSLGKTDSAIFYNKKGLEHATVDVKKDIALWLAKTYDSIGNKKEAQKYRDLCKRYDDTINIARMVESKDFIDNVKKGINNEQKNISLTKTKKRLFIAIFICVMLSFAIVAYLIKANNKRKKLFELRQKRTDSLWNKWKNLALSDIREKKEHIKSLETELSSSIDKTAKLQQRLMESESEKQMIKEKQASYERTHSELLAADFADTEIYKLFHDPMARPTNSDFHKLADLLNEYNDGFTLRLKELYTEINNNELWLCCMVKAGLTPKEICNINNYKYNTLSMMKARLYGKLLKKKGTTKDFDNFIRDF